MAVTFIGAGAIANNANSTSLAISSHASTAVGDVLIAQIILKNVTANAVTPPDGTWSAVITQEVNDCTTAADDHQYALFWKRATVAGAQSYTFTKASNDSLCWAGVISAWRGARGNASASPLDATAAARTETAAAAANVSFPAYDPAGTDVHAIFMAYYGNDLTTFAAAMSNDVNPDCTLRYDLETATGNDASLACTSGDNDGSNIAARTWASAATANAGNTGVVFALVAATAHTGQARFAGAGSFRADVTQISGEVAEEFSAADQIHFVPYYRTILYPSLQAPTPFAEAVAHQGEARFAGAGSLSAQLLQVSTAQALFAGAGNLSVDTIQAGVQVGQATFQGAGNLSAQTQQAHLAQARFSGSGNLSVNATIPAAVVAVDVETAEFSLPIFYQQTVLYQSIFGPPPQLFGGTGDVLFSDVIDPPIIRRPSTVHLYPSIQEPVPVPAAGVVQQASASFAGAGSFSAFATVRLAAQATFAGVGNLSARTSQGIAVYALFAGTGSLSAYARQGHRSQAIFGGIGNLSAQALQAGFQTAEARFDGIGNLSAHVTGRLAAQARFQGSGSFSVYARQTQLIFARFGGTGSLSVDAAKIKPLVQATFQGAGNLSANVTALLPAFARFAGSGSLSASAQQHHVVRAIFSGAGNFSAHASIVTAAHVVEATFQGAGNLSARIASQGTAAYALFAGSGTLSAYARQSHRSQAIFDGAGSLRVEIAVRTPVVAEARFAGTGSLAVQLRQNMRAQARFDGAGDLAVHAGKSHFIEAIFGGRGDLSFHAEAIGAATKFAEAIFNGEGSLSVATIIHAQRRTTSRRGELTAQSVRDNTPNDVRPDPAINRRPTHNPRRTQR